MLEIKTGRKTEQKETREGAGGPSGGGGGTSAECVVARVSQLLSRIIYSV